MTAPIGFLASQRTPIIEAAAATLRRLHSEHYGALGVDDVYARIEALYDRLLSAVARHDVSVMLAFAETLAYERFEAGYELTEIQTAFNVLEEVIWSAVFDMLEPRQYGAALGPVTATLGAGKDAMAARYVVLATRAHAPAVDLEALFAGASA